MKFLKKYKSQIKKILILIGIVGVICLSIFLLMKLLHVDTIEGLQEICNKYGYYSYLIIILLQIIQVIFIPINNTIITIPAIVVVGVKPAFFCSWIGITIGTIILYFIGKYGGYKLLNWIISDKEKCDKYIEIMKSRKSFYPIGMLLGVIPDDLLTVSAGLCKLNFLYVLIVSIITRGICLIFTILGYGYLIKTWWGIVLMVLGAIIVCVLGYLTIRYGDKLEQKFLKKGKRKNER